jgi:hypothetical protein
MGKIYSKHTENQGYVSSGVGTHLLNVENLIGFSFPVALSFNNCLVSSSQNIFFQPQTFFTYSNLSNEFFSHYLPFCAFIEA